MIKTNPKMVKDFFEKSQQNIVIDTNRKELLVKIANKIATNYNNGNVNINFICTHNSRRSQLGQVWSFFAADNKTPYFVLTTCNNADENCPFIPEAIERFHVPYIDPKHSDDTDSQDETYLKTSEIIAAQMYYLFDKVKTLL